MGFFQFLTEQFWYAFPILICAGVATVIAVERFWALFLYLPLTDAEVFFKRVFGNIMKAQFKDAMNVCEVNKRKPTANIVMAALTRAHLPESVIYDGLQLSVQSANESITKRTSYLATIANVATLLGLFGTIAGLVASFEAVAHADAQQKSILLAAGISTAMNTTLMGLGVAIPCMILYAILMNKTNRMIAEFEKTAVRSLDIMKQRFYASDLVQSPLGNPSPDDDPGEKKRKAA